MLRTVINIKSNKYETKRKIFYSETFGDVIDLL